MFNELNLLLTVIIMQWFSLTAPQHPKNATTKTITPTMISTIGAEAKLGSTNSE